MYTETRKTPHNSKGDNIMKHFSMANQKAMALDITYPFGRRFAKAEYWEAAKEDAMFEAAQAEAEAYEDYMMGL